MATLGSTQVNGGVVGLPMPIGGLHLEIWRISGAGSGTVGDTATIVPKRGRYVVAGAAGHAAVTTIGTNGTDTNVVFTLTASMATNVTFDAWILVAE